jgi:hypothetical protein
MLTGQPSLPPMGPPGMPAQPGMQGTGPNPAMQPAPGQPISNDEIKAKADGVNMPKPPANAMTGERKPLPQPV